MAKTVGKTHGIDVNDVPYYVLQAVLETVAKITHEKGKKNDTQEAKYGIVILLFLHVKLLNCCCM